jgi:hypothetical protein
VLPSFGVQFTNRLNGAFRLQGDEGAERPVQLEITGEVPNLLQALLAARVGIKGVISLTGFADDKPVSGEMEIAPLRGVKLQLQFVTNAGAPCRLEVSKGFDFGDAFKGKTELAATLRREGGQEVGTVRLEVDLKQSFGQFWGSLRPTTSMSPADR